MKGGKRMIAGHGPVVIRRRLGAALKQLRGERGLHLQVVARELEVSSSKLSRLETGQVAPRLRDVRDLLEIYQAPADVRDRILAWAQEAKEPGWWQPFSAAVAGDMNLYISLETEARKIRMYSLQISGLLQTADYARMLLSGVAPNCTPGELDELVDIRVGRKLVLDLNRSDAPPVILHVVQDEAALHRGPKGPIMAGQLIALLDQSEWPNVTVQVLPFEAGYVIPTSTFAIFEPRNSEDGVVVNVESAGQDAYFDSQYEIAKYDAMWENVLTAALNPSDSQSRIRKILRKYYDLRSN